MEAIKVEKIKTEWKFPFLTMEDSSHICREAASLLKELGEIMIMMMIDDGNDYE